ncbi:hypothetical protein K505DRAFT_341247 [Melanomma pulvis-pyrius CBS 109.77]|uniref:Uncharacterized protein n=1 Tax=Melanomma pulvis-pyrius CBS 109.77 TaxID=1314802 RepID=A0A6A6WZX5_9PLEO|nr:hypothetical protein K505DRAFT_341247 [Melanomma pulvis-pyrius CBS 109.77]
MYRSSLSQSWDSMEYLGDAEPGTGSREYLPEPWLGLMHGRIPRGLSIIELVSAGREFQVSDPRDKVFGILSLSLCVDYAQDACTTNPPFTSASTALQQRGILVLDICAGVLLSIA